MTQSKRYQRPAPTAQIIFENCVQNENQCLIWQGTKSHAGYGWYQYKGKLLKTHRIIAIELLENPESKPWVLHSCDTPACCNPSHLRWGTPKDNAADRDSRNRGKVPDNRGSKASGAKLNEQSVFEIKLLLAKKIKAKDIATLYAVSQVTISNIKKGHRWSHVTLSEV